MKSILPLYTCLLMLAFTAGYSQKTQEIAVLKIQQNYYFPSKRLDSYIRTSYPDETTTTIKLAKAGFKADDTEEQANTKLIQKTINALTKDGYQLISSTTAGNFQCVITFMTFSRNKEGKTAEK